MIVEDIQNGDLNFNTDEYVTLVNGIVILPENIKDAEKIKQIKIFLQNVLD
tara:strand:- start:1242 stop:1394 length:153 start_codon:yes stop_codon:yes gene_type:complete